MTARVRIPGRLPLVLLAAGALVAGAAVPAVAASGPGSPSAQVSAGDGWTVTPGAAGYTVSLRLDARLPVRDDIPELLADGVDLGPATESADGRTLTATTADPAVASASTITWQWSTGGSSTATGPTSLTSAADQLAAQQRTQDKAREEGRPAPSHPGGNGRKTTTDPTTVGRGAYTVADYDFGAQSVPLADIGGIRGELEGRIYAPTGHGKHPLVIFLHGRHSACYNTTTLKGASGWPCPAGTTPILSYAGYDGAGEALAADGYTVVSISANAVNANDNQLSPDDGAGTRGQLVLDTLTMLKAVDAGRDVTYHDDATGQDVTFGQALAAGRATYPEGTLTAQQLAGSMDFDSIGLMGHSRGGEGVVTAATLNESLPHPWSIKSVFALAPIDFTRAALPDVITTTLLPYCDGDVSDQQGQHFYADSRDSAFDDDVQRSDIWVMGTDHDFYNSSWTPPYPGASDDWSKADDPVCGTSATALASGRNIRLTAAQQYQVGAAYIAGFFESTLGRRTAFQGMFDGSGAEPPSVSGFADVRTVAEQPASDRSDITTFKSPSPLVSASGDVTATVCANKYGRTVPEALPYCTNPGSTLTNQQVPYWTPANYAPNVPLNPMTHVTWTGTGGGVTVAVPQRQQDLSPYEEMAFDMSPDESVASATDMTVTVTDTSGRDWRSPVSALNPWAVTRMPASTSTTLGKIVLQQVHIPTSALRDAGLDLRHLAAVRFTPAPDDSAPAGVYLSDLTFDRPSPGTPHSHPRPTVNVDSTSAQAGPSTSTGEVAVYLSRPSSTPVTAYLTVLGSATGALTPAMSKVTFSPGTTCVPVPFPIAASPVPAGSATSYKAAVSTPTNAVLGANDFATITLTDPATTPPPPADVCAAHH